MPFLTHRSVPALTLTLFLHQGIMTAAPVCTQTQSCGTDSQRQCSLEPCNTKTVQAALQSTPMWKVNSSVTPKGGNTPSLLHQESTRMLYHGRTSPTQLWEQEIDAAPSALDMDKNLISILSCSLLITIQINYSAAESKTSSLVISLSNLMKWGNTVKLW